MNWLLFYEAVYLCILILVCLRIVYDTQSTVKTLAYLLIAIFVPFAGMLFYFFFGINYRKRKMYSKKLFQNESLATQLREDLMNYSRNVYAVGGEDLRMYKPLIYMLAKGNLSALTATEEVSLLQNGEEKFPAVLRALESAKHHIHVQYYIYEDDNIGGEIEKMLIKKASEGVEVRFIYDDFGSRSIRKKLVPRLSKGGVKAFPFYKINFILLSNRLNYRNHRKLIIIDGVEAFLGGINISDKYINEPGQKDKLFWRDTHLRIRGSGVMYLQYLFFCDWNFCAKDNLAPTHLFFPARYDDKVESETIVQIAASGPDSEMPTILYTILQAIHVAESEILITTPYFIPGESLLDAMRVAAQGGISVKLLVPGISDSKIVNAAACSYYDDLMESGVEVYMYKKGFIHAKTLVTDRKLAMVGTANMDARSFELNFEVNALLYDTKIASELAEIFYKDLEDAEKLDYAIWSKRSILRKLFEKTARLLSPLL